jgi:hypothetical protein
MKVASNVKTKKKTVSAGPGDDEKKKKNPPPSERGKEQLASTKPGATMYDVDSRADQHDKKTTLAKGKWISDRDAKKAATGFYSGGAAPRVGGTAQKSTTLYTGKGALPGAKKLPKASTKRSVVVKRKRI